MSIDTIVTVVQTPTEQVEVARTELVTERITEIELATVATVERITQGDGSISTETVYRVEVISAAPQGPPGIQGIPGPAGTAGLVVVAGEALGGHRAVVQDADGRAFYADRSDPTHIGRIAGITTGAAAVGTSVSLLALGRMEEAGWSWTPFAPVYLGSTGVLTQIKPVVGHQQVLGVALSATTVFIRLREPLALA